MRKRVAVEVDEELMREVVHRYRLAHPREAVHLALRALLESEYDDVAQQFDDEYDEFSDLRALHPRPASDAV